MTDEAIDVPERLVRLLPKRLYAEAPVLDEWPGQNVGRTQEPFRELDAAKRACQEHAERVCSAAQNMFGD